MSDFLDGATPVAQSGDFLADAKPAEQSPAPEGFWHSLGAQFGLTPEAAQAAAQDEKDHPIKAVLWNALGPTGAVAKGLYDQAKASGSQLEQAGESLGSGNKAQAADHAIQAVPILGPALSMMAENSDPTHPGDSYASRVRAGITPGNAGTAIGAAAQLAPAALGAVDAAVPGRPMVPNPSLPSRANAASVFNDLNTKLADQPVNLKATLAPLQRATEIGTRGAGLPGPVNALLQRSQMTEPMTFPEARDYQMSLTDLSRADKDAIPDRMKGAIAQINQGLFNDIYDAAEVRAKGLGGDFADAMKEYRQASQIKNAATTAAKAAIPTVVGGGLLAHYLKEMVP